MSSHHYSKKTEPVKTKHCPKCDTDKPLAAFGRDASRPDGRYTYCKQCRRNPSRQDREVLELAEKGLKICTLCSKVKPFCAFDRDPSKSLGYTSRCKKCHREQRRAKAQSWHDSQSELSELERNGKTRCYRCAETKPVEFFLKNKNYHTGYCRLCLLCNNQIRNESRLHRKKSRRDYTRWEVFEADAFTCYICEDVLSPDAPPNSPKSLSIDHVYPISLGGMDERDNVKTACLECNQDKSDTPLEVFMVKSGRFAS